MIPVKATHCAAFLRAQSRQSAPKRKAPDLIGKPKSWKQVCDNERTVNIPQYTRTGTLNGKLTQVTIAAHCRNPAPRAPSKPTK